MSSPEEIDRSRRSFLHVALSAALAGSLAAGCQVRPLYGTMNTPGGQAVPADLAAIDIDPISDRYADEDAAREEEHAGQRGTAGPGCRRG